MLKVVVHGNAKDTAEEKGQKTVACKIEVDLKLKAQNGASDQERTGDFLDINPAAQPVGKYVFEDKGPDQKVKMLIDARWCGKRNFHVPEGFQLRLIENRTGEEGSAETYSQYIALKVESCDQPAIDGALDREGL
jgi:hypothetical protein